MTPLRAVRAPAVAARPRPAARAAERLGRPVGARRSLRAGFPVVATSSAGVAEALGYEDHEEAPVDEMLAAAGRIVEGRRRSGHRRLRRRLRTRARGARRGARGGRCGRAATSRTPTTARGDDSRRWRAGRADRRAPRRRRGARVPARRQRPCRRLHPGTRDEAAAARARRARRWSGRAPTCEPAPTASTRSSSTSAR